MEGSPLASQYVVARDHFQAVGAYMADFVAKGIAVTMFETESAFVEDDGLMGPASPEARVREFGRVSQAADEICLSCGWELKWFMVLVEFELDTLRKERYGTCHSNNCDKPADGDSHWCFECLHIEERLEREYYEG